VRPFRAGEAAYERSIAIDASTIGDITITVAVSAGRTDELAILDSIYRQFKASATGLDPVGEADSGRPAAGLSLPAHRPTVSKRLIRPNQNKSVWVR
jgi:hypothetical protein